VLGHVFCLKACLRLRLSLGCVGKIVQFSVALFNLSLRFPGFELFFSPSYIAATCLFAFCSPTLLLKGPAFQEDLRPMGPGMGTVGKPSIPGVNNPLLCLQEMWSLVGPPEAFIAYHREWHHNDKIKVADWSRIEGDEDKGSQADTTLSRHVYFMLPLDAPSWFRKAIGEPVPQLVARQLAAAFIMSHISCSLGIHQSHAPWGRIPKLMHMSCAGLDSVPVLDDQEVTTYKNGDLLLVLRPRLRTPSHERFPHVQVATLEWFFSHEWDTDGTIISKVLQ
jgi:hypothetical protein